MRAREVALDVGRDGRRELEHDGHRVGHQRAEAPFGSAVDVHVVIFVPSCGWVSTKIVTGTPCSSRTLLIDTDELSRVVSVQRTSASRPATHLPLEVSTAPKSALLPRF